MIPRAVIPPTLPPIGAARFRDPGGSLVVELGLDCSIGVLMPPMEPGVGNEGDTGEAGGADEGVVEHDAPADSLQSLSKELALFAFEVGYNAVNDLTSSQKQSAPSNLYKYPTSSQQEVSGYVKVSSK